MVCACAVVGLAGGAAAWAQCSAEKESTTIPVAWSQKKDIVDTAVAAGSFKTLAAALQAAGLVDALKGPGPFTVFAPTDEAFAKLPKGTLENLLKPENKATLVKILSFHVIAGEVPASQVEKMTESTATLAGETFDIQVKDGVVRIGNSKAMATVVKTDIGASNGVIHVIDTVLLPE
jgi:uncharacterized surface protein with fasciclin (FAS1) repeats